jgi:AGCS family alanine or glycine:cation symporter
LFGVKAAKGYKVFFVLLIVVSSIMQNSLAWDISDTFNGMMMLPNLIGVLALSPLVVKITKNYVDRRICGKEVEPLISVFPDIQREQAEKLKRGEE